MSLIKKPLLAATLERIETQKFPCWATEKIDGIRAIRQEDTLVSRTFKPIRNETMNTILSLLLPPNSDGEILGNGSFQDTTSAVMTHYKGDSYKEKFKFYWFDWVRDDPMKGYLERINDMKEYIQSHPEVLTHPQAQIIPLFPTEILTVDDLDTFEAKALLEGYEGVMLRCGDGKYKMGRSTAKEGILVKLKRFRDAEAEIVGIEELQHNENEKTVDNLGQGKRSGKKEGKVLGDTLGAFVVRNLSNDIQFKIGSGFTSQQRADYWNSKANLIGQIVRYKYFEIGSKECPRFPTFQGFRDPDDM